MKPRIPYTQPPITELVVRYATDAGANGWGTCCHEDIGRFEDAFKAHRGVDYASAAAR
jgi:perosamine synthetase